MYAPFKRDNHALVEANIAVMREFPINRNVVITKLTTPASTSANDLDRLLGTVVGYTYNSVGEVLIDVLPVRQKFEAGEATVQVFHVRNQMFTFQLI